MAMTTTTDHRTTATTKQPLRKKTPDPVDVHVGAHVRQARMLKGMSQETLAGGIGLTFQQVQKYEKGKNRIGSSRMAQISLALNRPIPWFYEGVGADASSLAAPAHPCQELAKTRDGLDLASAFVKIKGDGMRKAIVAMAQAAAKLGEDAC